MFRYEILHGPVTLITLLFSFELFAVDKNLIKHFSLHVFKMISSTLSFYA